MKVVSLQLTHAIPLKVQGENAALRQIDTTHLYVRGGNARRLMAVHIQNHWYFAGKLFGLIQQSGNPQTRNCFVTKLLDLVAWSSKRFQPLNTRFGFTPALCVSLKHDLVEHFLTDLFRDLVPLLRTSNRGH